MYMQNISRLFLFFLRLLHVDVLVPDWMYLKLLYRRYFNKELNLNNPITFNEKLQWLKLYDRRLEYTIMVDKFAVKKYVSNIIGEEFIIPTLGVWDKPEMIEWNLLPNEFVLKCTHDSGSSIICRDKAKFDIDAAIKKLETCLKKNYYIAGREWPYKNVPRRIIAEKYMKGTCEDGDLCDYKFFCFNGLVKALFVGTERNSGNVKFDYFDAEFNRLDLVQEHPMSGRELAKPKNFDRMKQLASRLSKGIPQVRVDFYNIDGSIYFGEMTFFHHGGIIPFHPEKWDYIFGSWIELPKH